MLMARGGSNDYNTPGFGIGHFSRQRPWERCTNLSKDFWSHAETIYTEGMVPVQGMIIMLAQVAGNGGNLVFNLPPNITGGYDPDLKQVMKEMGVLKRTHAEATYGTQGGPYYYQTKRDPKRAGGFQVMDDLVLAIHGNRETDPRQVLPWGASTCKGNKIYLHLLAAPSRQVLAMYEIYAPPSWKGEILTLPALPDRNIVKASILGKPEAKVDVKMDDKILAVNVPEASRDLINKIVVPELDKDAVAVEPINLCQRPASLDVIQMAWSKKGGYVVGRHARGCRSRA